MSKARHLARNRRGVVAIEYALAAPMFFVMVFGFMEVCRLLWVQVTLDRAVTAAARCGALMHSGCTTAAAVSLYASQKAPGMSVGSSAFTTTYPTCGVKVVAAYPISFVVKLGTNAGYTVAASACAPIVNTATL